MFMFVMVWIGYCGVLKILCMFWVVSSDTLVIIDFLGFSRWFCGYC